MPSSKAGSLVRLSVQHEKKPVSIFARSHMLMMTLKKGLGQPWEPVWGNRYLFSPVIVEEEKAGTTIPNWKNFLGFGHQFLLNASQTEDGILYFCIGFSISSSCQRDRHAILYLDLAPDAAESLLWLHHDTIKVEKLMAFIKANPVRRFPLGNIIPGSIIPRVVGTIMEAESRVQEGFFEAVTRLFYANGELPIEYTLENKLQVMYFIFIFIICKSYLF
jgi:hypothetical protein